MPVAASRILDFLEECETFTVERHVIASPLFGTLRQSVRQIVVRLRDSDGELALEISDRLRSLLSEWLTVPVSFDQSMVESLRELLREPNIVRARWGADISLLYVSALRAAENLAYVENPVRERLSKVISELKSHDRRFRIYCHRSARPHFESQLLSAEDTPLSDDTFLHSVRDYRETEPFDVLIKVGPLRSRGWGSAPDALITAPRFGTLILIVWSGCHDEPGFGYDPSSSASTAADASPVASLVTATRSLPWVERSNRTGEDPIGPSSYIAEVDELQIFREIHRREQTRRAKLIQVGPEHGILFPPYAPVLSYSPDEWDRAAIGRRIPGETLLEGMFVIIPVLDDVDLGRVQAEHGYYSRIWKKKLLEELATDEDGLIQRLHNAGLNLVHLAGGIRHWCKTPGTVIHAPQQIRHFRILLRVLGLENEMISGQPETGAKWWERAWNEIRRSRGEAIQAGVIGHEIVEEQLTSTLRTLLRDIREKALVNEAFSYDLPDSSGMNGSVLFFPVRGIEEGFNVPENQLRIVHELEVIDQWRD